jgi:small subunit ribosomal protein S8
MSRSDPIADMLTRIRNAQCAGHEIVEMPYSGLKMEISRILKREGYITDYVVEGGSAKKNLRLYLKYVDAEEAAIRGLRRVSRPGRRNYSTCKEIPRVLGGLGIAILSTSRGLMTDHQARREGVGGEVLCHVW